MPRHNVTLSPRAMPCLMVSASVIGNASDLTLPNANADPVRSPPLIATEKDSALCIRAGKTIRLMA
jgi:hypothetical protein